MQLVLFCGIQATGKSTFYQQRSFHTHVRLGLDLLRTRHREQRLLQVCLETQMRCVADNTNPTRAERATYLGPAKAAGFEAVGYFFQLIAAEALRRNQQRVAARQVPDQGIRRVATRNRLEIPSRAEGFDKLYFVRTRGNLFGHGTNYDDLPAWQKRGVGLYWEDYQKAGFNPHPQPTVETSRRRLTTNPELPPGFRLRNLHPGATTYSGRLAPRPPLSQSARRRRAYPRNPLN